MKKQIIVNISVDESGMVSMNVVAEERGEEAHVSYAENLSENGKFGIHMIASTVAGLIGKYIFKEES